MPTPAKSLGMITCPGYLLTKQTLGGSLTIRARGGVTLDNVLVYVTGGPAWVNAQHSAVDSGDCSGCRQCVTATDTTLGLAVGGGIEARLTQQWSAKVEYLYLDMPTRPTDAN